MTNPIEYIQRLEAENLRLQELLKIKEQELKDKFTDSFSRGFKAGIRQSEAMSTHVLEEWRQKNTIKYSSIVQF